MVPGAVIQHGRYVVIDQETVEADVLQRSQGGKHVDVPFVGEALLEVRHVALHVAEVDVKDAAVAAKVTDGVKDAFARTAIAVEHLRETADAKVQAMRRARQGIQHHPEVFHLVKEASLLPERGQGRVVRVFNPFGESAKSDDG